MNPQRFMLWLWWLLLAVFLSITAYYIAFHQVSPLSRDQWYMYDALLKQGLWKTSITTMSGHRHLLAFSLYDVDLNFFQGKNNFLSVVDWLLNGLLIAVLCKQITKNITDTVDKQFLSGWALLLFCWLINIALLGWGFNGINNYLSIVNTVLSILLLHHAVQHSTHSKRYLILSVLIGGLATLSFGNGILVWSIGLVSLFIWRAPRIFNHVFFLAAIIFFLIYVLLPGGDAVGNALHLNDVSVLSFPITLMGGPAFHLLRAWHFLPVTWLTPLATGVGIFICMLSLYALYLCWRQRVKNDSLHAVAMTAILIGFGTIALLMLTRVDGVLDPTVDRFQIWALLVWFGSSVLLYRAATSRIKKIMQIVFFLFPIAALPSQLDWGARLAEYRMRVDNALLAYQVYLPVSVDAERALHWNWQGKLPNLFPVLENLRTTQRNVFSDGAATWLNQPLPATTNALPHCQWSLLRQEPIYGRDLLDVRTLPDAQRYIVAAAPDAVVGWRWYATLAEPAWQFGLIADASGTVRGLLHPVSASLLPRANGLRYSAGNAYGIARAAQVSTLLVINHGEPLCSTVLH